MGDLVDPVRCLARLLHLLELRNAAVGLNAPAVYLLRHLHANPRGRMNGTGGSPSHYLFQ